LGLFAAVNGFGAALFVATSPDGIVWTGRASVAGTNWNDVIWSARLGLFIATNAVNNNPCALTSPDGITWTARNAGAAGAAAYVQDFGAAFPILEIQAGSGTYLSSPDGITWTKQVPAAPPSGPTGGVVFVIGTGAYCLTGAGQPYAMQKTSTNDLTAGWATINANAAPGLSGTSGFQKAAFSAQLGLWAFCAGGANAAFAVTASTGGGGAVTARATIATVAANPLLISAAF
jgi:hypothetical protein